GKLAFYYDYISELASLFLDSYSLCSSYYTQILSTNRFYERLVGFTQESKRTQLEEDNLVVPVDSTIELSEARQLLEEKFATQQKCIDAIVEIANKEHVLLIDNISLLVQDNS
ncbi:9503_t:CDS:2, partial [Scutellospora calospora]